MSAVRKILGCLAIPLSLVLMSCGGSSTQHVTAMTPIFTSTPPSAAAQDTAYSYSVAATDPSGGTITYALTTGPTGATLSGDSLSWTPTAAQSRTSNSFTITATTSEGATATQPWTVSPTGVVTVNWINTYWGPSGPVQVPVIAAESLAVSAIAPQTDGSLLVLKGAAASPGVITIAGVPAGSYWLVFGSLGVLPESSGAYWTNTNTFDAGRDFPGTPPALLNGTSTITFDLSLTDLQPVSVQTPILFQPDNSTSSLPLPLSQNITSFAATLNVIGNIDWSQDSTLLLAQYEPAALSPLNNAILGPSTLLSNQSFTYSSPNLITETLQTSPASLDLTIDGSQWASMLNSAGPATPSSYASAFSLSAEPYVTGRNASLSVTNFVLAASANVVQQLFAFSPFAPVCDPTGFPFQAATTPAILTDQDLGTLQYSDPFDPSWTRTETFCEEGVVPIPVPNSKSTVNFALVDSETVAPSSTALAPIISPVQSPTIGGASLFAAATLNTTTPSLSWSAPASGSPYGYRVDVFVGQTSNGISTYIPVGVFGTSQTSVTLPPLSSGNTYVFSITALADAAANIQTSPNRSALPAGFANVVSAPITISSSAAQVQIRGDANVVRQLLTPRTPAKDGLPQEQIVIQRK